jgi:SM-20-related protein
MSHADAGKSDTGAPPLSVMPPYRLRRNFLDDATVGRLLDYALANQFRFEPTKVYGKGVNPLRRISLGLNEFDPPKRELKEVLRPRVAEFAADFKLSAFEFRGLELELVAHGDGAFFSPHIDTLVASGQPSRVISGVFYFHAMPKAFTGGEFRMHGIGPAQEAGGYLDIAPEHNLLLTFPAWAPHEVRPVSCPSKAFRDSRFAINIWVHRVLPGTEGTPGGT